MKSITTAELAQLLPTVALVDVREAEEYAAGHIPAAKNIPLSGFESALPQLEGETYIICQSGGRSAYACELLAQAGMSVTNVQGGMNAWRGEVE